LFFRFFAFLWFGIVPDEGLLLPLRAYTRLHGNKSTRFTITYILLHDFTSCNNDII